MCGRIGLRVLAGVGFGLVVAVCAGAGGNVIYVDDDAPAGGGGTSWAAAYKYLQDGLADANSIGGEVEVRVAQGIYRPDRSEASPGGSGDRKASFVLFDGLSLIGGYAGIGSADPNARDVESYETILSGDLAGDDVAVDDPCDMEFEASRFENSCNVVEAERVSGIRLEGFVIRDGHANISKRGELATTLVGAGMRGNIVDDFVVRDCKFIHNYAGEGPGGCGINGESVKVENCIFSSNSATIGGGISAGYSNVILSECEISENYGVNGGGMAGAGQIELLDCIIKNNKGGNGAGARFFDGNVNFRRCIIKDNIANWGGGIVISGSRDWESYKFKECCFAGNIATSEGGAFVVFTKGIVEMDNCIVAGNKANIGGAIRASSFVNYDFRNCTVTENIASLGSFIYCDAGYMSTSGSITVANTIVMQEENVLYTEDMNMLFEYSLLSSEEGEIYDPNSIITFGVGNIFGDPCFSESGFWENGGTQTNTVDDIFVIGDYHLKSQGGRWLPKEKRWVKDDMSSQCIDAGNPMSPIGYEIFPNGGRVNMGVYGGTREASKSYFEKLECETIIAGDINGDCRVDFIDVAILVSHWLESGF